MAPTPVAPGQPVQNEISSLKLLCKGVKRSEQANSDLAYSVRQYMNSSPSFTNALLGAEGIKPGDDTNTFTFEMTVDLRHHFKL